MTVSEEQFKQKIRDAENIYAMGVEGHLDNITKELRNIVEVLRYICQAVTKDFEL